MKIRLTWIRTILLLAALAGGAALCVTDLE